MSSIATFIKQLVWPKRGKLSRLFGAVSILKLYELGFTFGFGAALGQLLEYYDWVIGRLVWPVEPLINIWFGFLRRYIGWPTLLYPHWKHVFVLLGLYFFRETLVGRIYGWDYVIWYVSLGLLVALTFGALAGSSPLNSSDNELQLLFAAVLIAGAAVHGVIGFVWDATFLRHRSALHRNKPVETWWGHFSWGISRILSRSVIALGLVWGILQAPIIRQLPSPGIAASVILILLFGIYWLIDGFLDSGAMRREDESRISAYLRHAHTQLGLAMLGPIFWCGIFVVMRAGNVL